MRILFFGTPEHSVAFLELLASRGELVAAVSQPDRPAGRGLREEPTPVKRRALELGIPVLQPGASSQIAEAIRPLHPDLAVAVAYGKILKTDALAVPRLGTLNVHFSLLPKYRGAAPVQWSLARGETRTGVTVFWLDEGMDTGPVFLKRELDIGAEEDAGGLLKRLTSLGLEALGEALAEIEAGRIVREPQSGPASLAPLIRRQDARITFPGPARRIHDLVRGMRLWPRATLDLELPSGPLRVQVLKTRLPEPQDSAGEAPAGTIVRVERGGGFLIQCDGSSRLWLLTVQPQGKKPVTAADFLNGLRLAAGNFLPVKE